MRGSLSRGRAAEHTPGAHRPWSRYPPGGEHQGCGMRSTTAGRHYTEILQALITRPDEVMLEVGAMLLLLPLANAATGGQFSETLIGLAGAVFVNVFAQVWLALARHGRRF